MQPQRKIEADEEILFYCSTQENWKGVIGLEIHAQINCKSKLFSASSTTFGAPTNSQVSIFDAALPGTLPVLNGECVRAGVKTAIALRSKINRVSKFDRKHYFYADLPQGYQITQQRQPLAVGGEVEYILIDEKNRYVLKTARVTQLQLEQDSGQSLHDEVGRQSLIDLNRAGIGLMEIVTEPDFENGIDCSSFVREVQLMMRQMNVCLGSFREGALRVDANISVHRPGEPLGIRSEVKNLGSLKALKTAVDYEVMRQIDLIKSGGMVVNETRTFDAECGRTIPMRDKERLQDYRFMPEPNLPPLYLYDSESAQHPTQTNTTNIDEEIRKMPPLPRDIRTKLLNDFNISLRNVYVLVNEDKGVDFFNEVVSHSKSPPKIIAKFIVNDLLGVYKQYNTKIRKSPISPAVVAEIIDLKESGYTTAPHCFELVKLYLEKSSFDSPKTVVDNNGWQQIVDVETLRPVCEKVITDNSSLVKKYCKGKQEKSVNSLILRAMDATQKKGNRAVIKSLLVELLEEIKLKK
ncbi:glutamyl-tRNA(Gln) amidotransferase subunit B, mitochondrial-like isoform X2 [Ostrea edulis]|uniref:glutamyl-tRNA(Gln) amidotransferase subunit B, mitochondrial-like isoform X2 n=1 Tax=Ostrea edulis TaxID=37623 RepID=UPI0024AEED45|nr:glutamyl-tRNA(Gln) amidotransferase subunit B, mitochondrial-like isoform X2 [Ostrea edulis]